MNEIIETQAVREMRAEGPAVAVTDPSTDVHCTDWVRVEGEFNPCGVRKILAWSPCPNRDNHVNRVVKANTLDEISEGDRIEFYHPASNRDQWAEVLEWTPAEVIERTGQVSAWDAVLLVDDLGLGNGFSAGRKCIRQRIERWRSSSVRFAYTPGVYRD
jgi:hypothetical protein